ncbi:hypothetical protein ACOSP7_032376 [Xanthoceras sorbifolium]
MEIVSTVKVRLVRCPKCRLLLPEPADVLVYKCGGCSTVLQVKKRKNDAKSNSAGSHGTEAAQMNKSGHVSEVNNSISSSPNASLSSSGERPWDQNIERDQDISTDCTSDKFGGANSSNEDRNDESYHNESRDCNIEQPGVAHCGNEDSSQSNGANSEVEVNDESSQLSEAKSAVDISNKSDSTVSSSNTENTVVHRSAGDSISSDVLISSPDEQPERLLTTFKQGYDRVRSNDAFEANSEVEVNDKSSHLAEAKLEVDINNESDSTSRSSDAENLVVTQENHSTVASHRPAEESVSSDVLISSPDEQPEQLRANFKNGYDRERCNDPFGANSEVEVNDQSSQLVEDKSAVDVNNGSDSNFKSLNTGDTVVTATVTSHRPAGERVSSGIDICSPDERPKQLLTSFKHGFGRVRSNETFESTSFFSPSSELSGTIDYMSKSPTTRSSHAYDGSVSSFDGTDDQVPDQHIHSYTSPRKFASSVVPEERSRRDKFLVNGIPEMRRQTKNLSSVLSDKSYYPMNHRKWDRDVLQGPTRHDHAVRNGTRFERNEFRSPASFYQRDYLAGYESGSAFSQLDDEFHNHASEQEKIRLLKMVYELQDQLNGAGYVNDKAAKEKYVPAYYCREISEEEMSRELNIHRYPERYRQGSNWSHQYKYAGIPFSGEVTNNRHCIDNSYLHCCPQEWQCSTQLPPPIRSHSRGFCTFHPGHGCYSSHGSCPSSPQQFTDSEFPVYYREMKSDDQRHEEYHVKRHTKEQPHLVKRHLRPKAGGAPFIICYCCLKPLQLPADFLLFKRRFHKLRCGACSEVLKFSLENRIQIVPYTPKAEPPLRSEVVDYRDAINRRNSSSSHGNDYPQADPVSCSDDYGLPYCKSYSTDGDPVILAPFHNIQGNADARNTSYGSPESMKKGNRFVPRQSQDKNKIPVETYESAGTSSHNSRPGKVSSEIQELPVKTGSPLHWLMGYNSPSQVIRGSDPSSSGTSSLRT